MENITRGTKRPAEPGAELEVQPQPNTSTGSKLSFRMSSIPIGITKDSLTRIIEGLATFRDFQIDDPPQSAPKLHRGTNVRFISLAPSASALDSDKYQVATVTLNETPRDLVGCVSKTETYSVPLRMEGGGEIEVDVDVHFLGLTPLNYVSDPVVDIIAVTGLGAHAFGSWRSRKSGKMWLRDFLPEDIPGARILTYGYDTKLVGSQSDAGIAEYAKQFLETITNARLGNPNRPIIFIGHSLGGLVIKKALTHKCEIILRSCYGILFFGVPHRGLENTHLIPMVHGQRNAPLVQNLCRGSEYLGLLHRVFWDIFTLNDSKIISIYETRDTKTTQKIPGTDDWARTGEFVRMVTRESAIYTQSDEIMYHDMSIDADHSTMVKFHSRSDERYVNIRKYILELANDAPKAIEDRLSKVSNTSNEPRCALREPILQIQSKVEDIFTAIQEDERLRILNWLSAISFKKHHDHYRSLRIEGTGGWLLAKQSFLDWNRSGVSALLWLRGDAGTGKTTLASKLIDDMKPEAQCSLAYFYCNYKEDQRRDPASILRSLIKQLFLMSQPGFPEPVLNIYKRRLSDADLTNLLSVAECKDILIQLCTGFLRTTIIIDALDECDPATRGSLCDVLEQAVSSSMTPTRSSQNSVKVFITSRNDGDLRRRFEGSPNVYIQERDSSEDINLYIKTEIDAAITRKELLGGAVDWQLKQRIVDALEAGARGMFIWVKFQIQRICHEITESGVEIALTQLPQGLHEMYSEMLERIRKNISARTATIADVALKLVLFAVQPLSAEELVEAILFTPMLQPSASTSSRDNLPLAAVLGVCQNLLVLDDRLKVIRFAHFSIQEFLLTQFTSDEVHTCIAEICLSILLTPGAHGRRESKKLAMTNYSTINWPEHLRLSGVGSNALAGFWKEFLTSSSPFYQAWANKVAWRNPSLGPRPSTIIPPLLVACFYELIDVVDWILCTEPGPSEPNKEGRNALHFAATNGNHHILSLLLKKEVVDLNSKDIQGISPLLLAVEMGHEKVVQLLLETEEVDITTTSDSGETILSLAVARGYEKVVQLLIQEEVVEVECRDLDRRTALSWAAGYGHWKVVRLLIEHDEVDVMSTDRDGRTPLSWAAGNGHWKVVRELIEKEEVDVESRDIRGRTPLAWAAANGHSVVVRLLINRDGIDVEITDRDGRTPLSWAAANGHSSVVELLIEHDGVDVMSTDRDGRIPLSWAAANGHSGVVELLIEHDGVDVESIDRVGRTPLSLAAVNGHWVVVRVLIENGNVNIESRDIRGRTPLSWAAANGHLVVAELLIEHDGVDVESIDRVGRTPLCCAATNGHLVVLQTFIEKEGVCVQSRDIRGRTPLSWAAANGHLEVVELLIEHDGVDVMSTDRDGRMPLSWAAANGHPGVVELLIEHDGVDVECTDRDGRTPLSWAAAGGNSEVVQLLIEHDGVDIESTDRDGRTPLSWAAAGGNSEVVQLLIEKEEVDVDSRDIDGRTPLSWAAALDQVTVVKILLAKPEVHHDSRDMDGRTPLSWAAARGCVVGILLAKANRDVNSQDADGRTSMDWVREEGLMELETSPYTSSWSCLFED